MRHEAIRLAYPNAGMINGESEVWDEEGNRISIDESLVAVQLTKLHAEYDAQEYARNRATAFPSIGDQLDMQYHDLLDGTTTWKDAIAKVKEDNPKPDGWEE